MSQLAPSFADVQVRAVEQERSSTFLLHSVMLCAWLIMMFVFYLPGRNSIVSVGGMDLLAIGKALSRIGSLGLLLALNLMMYRQMQLRVVFYYMGGFVLFLVWSGLTVTWSALPEVSTGQVISLTVMMLIGASIARVVETDNDAGIVLTHLAAILMVRCIIMVVCYVATGGVGVSREEDSYFHSTDAAETSTLGLLVLAVAFLGYPNRMNRLMLVPGIVFFLATFIIAQNRLSLIITPPLILITMLMNGNKKSIVALFFMGCLAGIGFLIYDPGLETFRNILGMTEEYAMRSEGDGAEAVSTFSGRTELWEAIWPEFMQSPIIGLGYFVTSTTGELNVWGKSHNYTAHNQLFQVLATTGIIGLMIFLSAMILPARLVMSKLLLKSATGRAARSLFVIFIWLVLWGLLNSSFCGPIGGSSVAFWTIIGMTIGRLRQSESPALDRNANLNRHDLSKSN